ncbi:MAG: hypothetical protein ABI120_11780 [Gemmatimonadaceae bacterium]
MTSYLAALSVRERVSAPEVSAHGLESPAVGIAPRRASAFEPWSIAAAPSMKTEHRDVRDFRQEEGDGMPGVAPHTAPTTARSATTKSRLPLNQPDEERASNDVPRGEAPAPIAKERAANTASPHVAHVHHRHREGLEHPAKPHAVNLAANARQINVRAASEQQRSQTSNSDTPKPIAGRMEERARPALPIAKSLTIAPLRIEPRAEPKAAARDAARKDAPPSVVVTIGRIEIRAMPSTTARKSAPVAQPAMSLADYLRERAQGLR